MNLTDKLSELYRPLRRILRPITFGLTLMTSSYCGSDDGERVVYPCRTSADCNSGSCVEGYCEGGKGGNNGSTEYTCESGTQMMLEVCCPRLRSCESDFYSEFLEECQEEIYGESQNNPNFPQNYFPCAYAACTQNDDRATIREELDNCEILYFSSDCTSMTSPVTPLQCRAVDE